MKKINAFLIFFLILKLFTNCASLTSTNNRGGYTIKVLETNSKNKADKIKISYTYSDIKTGELLDYCITFIDCHKITPSPRGEYILDTSNLNGGFFVKGICVGYRSVQTKYIKIGNKKHIQIDFHMVVDDRPKY